MNSQPSEPTWSLPGEKQPTWANALGWALVFGILVSSFISVRMGDNGYKLYLGYSLVAGAITSFCATRTKSFVMLAAGIVLLLLYPITVVILGVNTP